MNLMDLINNDLQGHLRLMALRHLTPWIYSWIYSMGLLRLDGNTNIN